MPDLTPTGAVDVLQRQVRRVRRRRNLYELQRALYWMIAAGAGAATLLLPLALFAPAEVFAIAAWSTLVVLAGVALLLLGATRRRWLARRAAVVWIETRAGLAGRLRTLLELAERPAAATSFFHALLVAEIARDLETWTPRRLLPRGVPRIAGATALITTAILIVALRLAALAVPTAPSVVLGDQPLAGARPAAPSDVMMGERVVVAPGVPRGGDHPSPAVDDGRDEDSTLARLADDLQENVRRQVWGKAWERVRDALARAGTSSGGGGTGDTPGASGEEAGAEEFDESVEWEIARAPSGELTRRRRPGIGHQPATRAESAADADAAAENPQDSGQGESDGGQGGGGAGSGTAPELFGAPSADDAPANASFELSLAARMRADGGTDRRGGGTAPDADPDARPVLAAEQRRESAAHRMAVPAAYEAVIREVFAHRRPESSAP